MSLPPRQSLAFNIGALLLRVVVAGIFVHHGIEKLFTHTAEATAFFQSQGFSSAPTMVLLSGVAEFVGGILLAIGLGARYAATAIGVVMAVAIVKVHGFSSWSAVEFPSVLLASSLLFVLAGGGDFGLDGLLARRKVVPADTIRM
jgi:putative oxidoreductase